MWNLPPIRIIRFLFSKPLNHLKQFLVQRNGRIKNNKWIPTVRQYHHMGWVYGNKMNHDINRVGVIWWCYRTFQYYLHLRLNRMLLMDNLKVRDTQWTNKKTVFYDASCRRLYESINTFIDHGIWLHCVML